MLVTRLKVLSSEDAKSFDLFESIEAKMVFSSDRTTIILLEIPLGAVVPEHSHPHEQMGFCLQGRAQFVTDEGEYLVKSGMFYWIRPNEKHSVKIIGDEKGTFVDIFSPPREDYTSRLKNE
jgi:quercetin dioxygenase-like cupin family protein